MASGHRKNIRAKQHGAAFLFFGFGFSSRQVPPSWNHTKCLQSDPVTHVWSTCSLRMGGAAAWPQQYPLCTLRLQREAAEWPLYSLVLILTAPSSWGVAMGNTRPSQVVCLAPSVVTFPNHTTAVLQRTPASLITHVTRHASAPLACKAPWICTRNGARRPRRFARIAQRRFSVLRHILLDPRAVLPLLLHRPGIFRRT